MSKTAYQLHGATRAAARAFDSRDVDGLIEAREIIDNIINRYRDPDTGELPPELRRLADDALTLVRLAEDKLVELAAAAAEARLYLGRLMGREHEPMQPGAGFLLMDPAAFSSPRPRASRRQRHAASTASADSSDDDPAPLSCSVDAAALSLGVSPRTIRRLVASGRLRSRRIGRRVVIQRDDLRDFLRSARGAAR